MLGGLNNLYRMSLLLTADVRGFTSGLSRAETRLAKFSQRATAFGRSTARGLGLAFAFVGSQAVKAAAEFDRANAILEKIVGLAGIDRLTAQAKELGRTSVFMATDISKAQLEIAKLGLKGEALEQVLTKSKDVATIFGTEIDATGKTLLATLRQFGLAADSTAEGTENISLAADVMASAFKNSALDLSKFSEAMKNVGPTARATGLDMVQTTALLAVLANNAVQGSLGGTKLRSTLSDLAAEFPDVANALERLENGTLSYAELVELLNKRAALVGAIFQDQGDEIRDFEAILRNATGTVDVLADGLEKRLFFQVERLKNSFQSMGITIGNGITPIVTELADVASDLAIALEQMDPAEIERIGRAIIFFIEAAAASFVLGKALSGITALKGAIDALDKTFYLFQYNNIGGGFAVNLGKSFKSLAGPLGLITGLIYGVGKAVEYAFSEDRIIAQNKFLREQKLEYEQLIARVEELRRLEAARLQDERRIPAQGRQQLEEFLGVDNIEDAFDELEHFTKLEGANLKRLAEIREIFDFTYKNRAAGVTAENLIKIPPELIKEQKDTEKFLENTRTYIDAYVRYIDLLSNLPATPEPIQVGDGLVAGRQFEVPLRFGEQGVIDRTIDGLNEILKVQQGIQGLPKAGTEGIFIFSEDQTEAQAISAQRAAESISALAAANIEAANSSKGLVVTKDNIIGISEGVEQLNDNLADFENVGNAVSDAVADAVERARVNELIANTQQLYGFLEAQLQFIGEAFLQASESGEKFFDVLRETFLRTFRAIIAKLITLIALYAVLAALSGGTGNVAQLASLARGENFLAFLGNGFGLPTGVRSVSSGTGGGAPGTRMAVEGSISGSTIVLSNQRGARAIDRTFG